MFSKTLRRTILLPLLLASPLMGQTQAKPALNALHPAIKFNWAALLEDYQNRYVQNRLTWREFDYAKQFVCPCLPPPVGQTWHLCNSSVVGTSDQNPDDFVIYKPDLLKSSICLKCILINP